MIHARLSTTKLLIKLTSSLWGGLKVEMGIKGCESIYQTIFRAKLGPSTIKFVYAKFHYQGK